MTSERSEPPRATRRTGDATRSRILDAALEVFSEVAFEGASTRDIAERAGVTQPLINYHFGTKEGLWGAAISSLFDELNDMLTNRIDGLRGVDDATVLKIIIREFVAFSAAHPELHRIMTQECTVGGPRVEWVDEELVRPLYELTVGYIKRLVDAGTLPAIPPIHIYYLIIGMGPTMFVLAPECVRLAGYDPLTDDAVDAHVEAILLLLFGTSGGAVRAAVDT
jgi:TetR/AcrR family transcriptional regulator